DLLARRQHALRPVQLDVDVAAVDLLHGPAHHLAHPVVVILVDALALGLAHALDEHLLRRRDRVPAEVLERKLLDQLLADLDVRLDRARLAQIDLEPEIVRVLDDDALQLHHDPAAHVVEMHLDVGVGAKSLPAGGQKPCLERLDENRLVDALLPGDLRHRLHELEIHVLGLWFPWQNVHPLRRRSCPRIPSQGSTIKCDFRIAPYGSETVPASGSDTTIESGPAARSSPRKVRRPSWGSCNLTSRVAPTNRP